MVPSVLTPPTFAGYRKRRILACLPGSPCLAWKGEKVGFNDGIFFPPPSVCRCCCVADVASFFTNHHQRGREGDAWFFLQMGGGGGLFRVRCPRVGSLSMPTAFRGTIPAWGGRKGLLRSEFEKCHQTLWEETGFFMGETRCFP